MKILNWQLANPEAENGKVAVAAAKVLKKGGVVIYPTETLYGLGVNALDEQAVSKVFALKRRLETKPLSMVVRDLGMARKFVCIDSRAEQILSRIWPGPVTVVLRKKDTLPYAVTGGGETAALRVSNHPFVETLFERIDFPLIATSANRAGGPNLLRVETLREVFKDETCPPELMIDAGDVAVDRPSTVVDLTDVHRPRILRMGVMSPQAFQDLTNLFKL